jgi:rRNA small subunit pseudouridine methyltransferase Nep1
MRLLLADAALELVPEEISQHPSVVNSARKRRKKPSGILLDSAVHRPAMSAIPDALKRGRPDIVHFCLLTALAEDCVQEVYIHTCRGSIIRVDRGARLPKNYNRFVSLAEQLLMLGRVPPHGPPLLEVMPVSLRELVGDSEVILLDEQGEVRALQEVCAASRRGAFLTIGAYPRGSFSREILNLTSKKWSLGATPLEAVQVLIRILCACCLST